MITNHTQLLNALIEKYGLKSYLEIGVQNPANNFDKIKAPGLKHGVDPELQSEMNTIVGFVGEKGFTSDEFFASMPDLHPIYDLIFIDGLHHADQVKRDFENSLRCLSDHGFIVIHDVLPENEAGTKVPRETKQWWGDVYKFAMSISNYSGIGYKTFNIDNGCMLVWKNGLAIKNNNPEYEWHTYKEYLSDGPIALNVTDEVII